MEENTLHLQIKLKAMPEVIFQALTDSNALVGWFAEYADVAIEAKRYDFWGRFTPDAPNHAAGHHPLLESNLRRLKFNWNIQGTDTTVYFVLEVRDSQTIVVVRHEGGRISHQIKAYSIEDFWFLSLENLRRHINHKRPVRCDFSAPLTGNVNHTIEIEGTADQVFGALIKPEQLQRWIASTATVEPVVGGNYDFGWGMGSPLKIIELIPNQRLAYSWPENNKTSIVTWTLRESDGKTRLTILHSGFAPDEKTGGIQVGWLNFMSWIKSLVEYGADWQPAIIQFQPGMEAFYAASILAAQSELVTNI